MVYNILHTIFISPVGEDEIETSPGWDLITQRIAKLAYHAFILPLTHIINLSLAKGIFPDDTKVAKVIQIYKGGNFSDFLHASFDP